MNAKLRLFSYFFLFLSVELLKLKFLITTLARDTKIECENFAFLFFYPKRLYNIA